MDISKNLLFEYNLLENPEHKKNILIASLNLDDFNERFNSKIKLQYNPQFRSLVPKGNYDEKAELITLRIYSYFAFARNKEEEEDFILRILLYLRDFNLNQILEMIRDERTNKKTFKELVNNFKNHFVGFYPKGILSKNGEKRFEKETLAYGKVLDDRLESINFMC
jgi:hypothetical protein